MGVGPRMSDIVIHGNTVYLAARSARRRERDLADQGHPRHDRRAARPGGIGQDQDPSGDHLAVGHVDLFRDERGVGCLGAGRQHRARATGEAKLAAPEYKVEIIITAASDGADKSGRGPDSHAPDGAKRATSVWLSPG